MRPDDVDWHDVFGRRGARWLHTGGIFAALSDGTPDVIRAALAAAREHGTVISYDLNYRPSLWAAIGGRERAAALNREIVSGVDVLIGNEEDFSAALGFTVEGQDEHLTTLDPAAYGRMLADVVSEFPNLKVVATTLRRARSATRNDWGALCLAGGELYGAQWRDDLEVLDRVGGGDSFASGLIYGLLSGLGQQLAVEYGAAHGALAMTTPGDTSMATLAEVEQLMRGGGARISR